MKVGDNYIIFKTDKLFEDKAILNGNQVFFDPSFNPWLHVRTYGEVLQVPVKLKSVPLLQESVGTPGYHDRSPFSYKWLSDIQLDIRVGDKCYVHFQTIMKFDSNCLRELRNYKGEVTEYWFKVRYDSVIAVERQGQIIPIGSYALIEPDYENLDDILKPVYSSVLGPNGEKVPLPKSKWIQTKPATGYKYLKGTVRHVGSPLKGDVCEVKPGQQIYYRKNADWMNRIAGKDYFAIRQKHILGRFE